MWLEAIRTSCITRYAAEQFVIQWRVDVKADDGEGTCSFTVGRFLADELSVADAADFQVSIETIADSDSDGLLGAWLAVKGEDGDVSREFEGGSSIIYLYRFELHPAFVEMRPAVIDSFCRIFGGSAIILAQYHTTHLSGTEFEYLGFHLLPGSSDPEVDGSLRFYARDNTWKTPFQNPRYYDSEAEIPAAKPEYEKWLEASTEWRGLH